MVNGDSAEPDRAVAVFARTGEVWTAGYRGHLFSFRDVKGLSYIQRLLQHPNEELHAQNLMAGPLADVAQTVPVNEASLPQGVSIGRLGDAGEMLDAQAKLQYRQRLVELRREREELRAGGDYERADKIEAEIEFLEREILRAVGLGNRDRRAGSTSERARLNVTRAIKAAVQRISLRDPALGSLLTQSLRTGTYCSYSPSPRDRVSWQFSIEPESAPSPTIAFVPVSRPQSIFERAITGSTAFVGREAERAILRSYLERAVGGRGSIVMIGGPLGVGKTRMAAELAAEAVADGFLALGGCCYDREDAVPFVPVIEILEAALAHAPSHEAFRRALGEDAPEIARLMPQLRRLFNDIPPYVQAAPEQSRRILFDSVLRVLIRSTANRPVLLVFEDLHWADESTLSLLRHLSRALSSLRAIIIGTYRDYQLNPATALARTLDDLRRLHILEELSLRGLSHDGVAQMLAALSGRQPARSIVDAIASITDGNPFFVEEIFRHLSESGKLLDASGEFRRDLHPSTIDVPQTLRLAIGRRLSELSAEARRALALAAIIGRSFEFELLKASSRMVDGEALLDCIEQAEKAGLISESLESAEPRFEFSHELIRQTAMADVSIPRLQSMHLDVAYAIERLYADSLDEQAAELAHHLSQAGSIADPGKTVRYLATAASRALAQGGFDAALRDSRRALDLLEHLPESKERLNLELTLQIHYGDALQTIRGWSVPEFGSAFERAHTICQNLRNDDALFRVLSGLWSFHLVRGEHHRARPYADEMVRMAPQMGEAGILVQAFWALGCTQFFMGDFRGAHASFEHAVERYDRLRDRTLGLRFGQDPCMSSLCFDAITLWLLGYGDQAKKREHDALKLSRDLGRPFSLVWCLSNIGKYHTMRRDFVSAEAVIDEALALCGEHRLGFYENMNLAYWGVGMAIQGRFEELKSSSRRPPRGQENEGGLSQTFLVSALAESFARKGQIDRAMSLLDRAASFMNLNQERYVEAEIYRIRGESLLRSVESRQAPSSDPDQTFTNAEGFFQRAIETAARAEARMLQLRAAVSLAESLKRRGRTAEAFVVLMQSYSWFTEGFDLPDLSNAKRLLDELGAEAKSAGRR